MAQFLQKAAILACVLALVIAAWMVSRLAFAGVLALLLFWFVGGRLLLPRAAHGAFLRGDKKRARRLYRILYVFFWAADARAAIRISLGACELALDRYSEALREFGSVDVEHLAESARAALDNNRAYALARDGNDRDAALAASARAVETLPHVPAFHHTRGVALLLDDRVDDAIRSLEKAFDADVGPSEFESERCYDLGRAWERKGHGEYADEYYHRAHRAQPASKWAKSALARMTSSPPEDAITLM